MYRVETEFLNIVSMVAAQYDCVIEKVDFKTRTVSLSCAGGKAQETKCALAISEIVEGAQEQRVVPLAVWAETELGKILAARPDGREEAGRLFAAAVARAEASGNPEMAAEARERLDRNDG